MQNPWHDLIFRNGEYLLDIDREQIYKYNAPRDAEHKIVLSSVPEPFIGDPSSAQVVLLLLNPGHDDTDLRSHLRQDFKDALFKNLHHESQAYPFYPLTPTFRDTGSARWWRRRLGGLIVASGLDEKTIAQRLLAIEWFPYHSRYSSLPQSKVCESQEYSFHLAKKMVRSGSLVVGMRSKRNWLGVDRNCFAELPFLTYPRIGYVSRGNMEEGLFDRIVSVLRK
jgi:hypothetical protein